MVKENCGVVGIFSLDKINVIPMLIDSLRALQHRGQEAWGIAVPNKTPLLAPKQPEPAIILLSFEDNTPPVATLNDEAPGVTIL